MSTDSSPPGRRQGGLVRLMTARLGPQRCGELVLFVTTAVWGTSFVGVQSILGQVTPMAMLTLRFGVATLVLLPALRRAHLKAQVWRHGTALGIFLFAGFGLQTVSLVYTTATHTAFGTALMTIIVPSLSFLLWRKPWPIGNYLALISSLCGTRWLMGVQTGQAMQLGDLLSIASALAFAIHIILLNRFARVTALMPLLIMQLAMAGMLAALAWGLDGEPWPLHRGVHWPVLATVAYLGIMTTALCELGQIYGQARTSSTRAAFILALEPVFAAAFAYLGQGQKLSRPEWWGGSLIVGAALLADRGGPAWLRLCLNRVGRRRRTWTARGP